MSFINSSFALDAANDGEWISLGVPKSFHIGTSGAFYLTGDNQGSCGGVVPQYFRMHMNAPYFKEFYSWVLFMSAQKKPMSCVVNSSCGTSQIWVDYCRGDLN